MENDLRINVIKAYIATEEGWQELAKAISNDPNPDAKNDCFKLFKVIAGDTKIRLDGADESYYDYLVSQLETYLQYSRIV